MKKLIRDYEAERLAQEEYEKELDMFVAGAILLILTFRPHGFFGEPYSARLRL